MEQDPETHIYLESVSSGECHKHIHVTTPLFIYIYIYIYIYILKKAKNGTLPEKIIKSGA